MDEQAQAVKVGRRSRAEIEQLLADYEVSGLTRVEFCRKRGLSLASLDRYRRRHGQSEAVTSNRLVAVEVSGTFAGREDRTNSGVALTLRGGRRIEVRRGFDAHTLMQLLGVLEQV
jgi:hypothetical protein